MAFEIGLDGDSLSTVDFLADPLNSSFSILLLHSYIMIISYCLSSTDCSFSGLLDLVGDYSYDAPPIFFIYFLLDLS
jgi:hypothetical protein